MTLVHKTNVLTFAGDLWERTFHEVGEEYPDIEAYLAALGARIAGRTLAGIRIASPFVLISGPLVRRVNRRDSPASSGPDLKRR